MKHALKTMALLLTAALAFASCSDKDNDLYTVIVNANNAQWGNVYGGGKYEAGTEIQIAASPVAGYKFTRWNDDNTDNPRTVVVNADVAYTAIFEDINGGGDNPNPDPGYDSIPFDSNSYCWVTLGDTTWAGLAIIKQTGSGFTQMTIMSDENGEGPNLTWTWPGTEGTFNYNTDDISIYSMVGFSDLVEVNGQQYPHWLCIDNATITVTEYNLNAGYISCTITGRLLDMERESQGLSRQYRNLEVTVEKMYFLSYSK